MDWKEFVKETELLSDVARKYFAVEAEQKRHRLDFFERLCQVKQ